VLGLAVAKLAFHAATNGQYGFHRDELATLDDARHLAWGYVAYPPLTPFLGRAELALFGTSLSGFRLLAAAAQCAVAVLAALMARRFGGGRAAMLVAAGAAAFSPVSLGASALFQYVSFDALWCVLVCYLFVALLDTGDPRLWLAIGAALGLGALTKYTVGFYVAGLAAAVLASPPRRHLATRWPYLGALVSIVLFAPNLAWQAAHGFVSLEFLKSIHARDVAIGRTASFLLDQVKESAHPLTVPLWLWGLLALLFTTRLRRFRAAALLPLVSFALFALAKGRGYYTAPLYPVLFAAGAAELERALSAWTLLWRRAAYGVIGTLLVLAGVSTAIFALPLARPGSKLFRMALAENGDFPEEIGWPELVAEVARIYRALPAEERAHAGVFCGNYGEAGAVDLYGPAYGLPAAISGIDSYWERGPGVPPPTTLIVLGATRERVEKRFGKVELAGHTPNPLGVANEETTRHPDIFVCREPLDSIEKLWPKIRSFG
jgi:hypothetical protein